MDMKRNVGPKLTQEALAEAQRWMPFPLPAQVTAFYMETNGGVPVNDGWTDDKEGVTYWIKQFLSFANPADKISVESLYALGVGKDYLDATLVPFALDHGGNYFCFDQIGGVHFYALDGWGRNLSPEENKRKADVPLTASFNAFIENLVPYVAE